MSASALSPSTDRNRGLDRKENMRSAREIRKAMRGLTLMGIPFDVLWHHYLRQFYIGPPTAGQTFRVYAFWAGIWYCASRSGDWVHAAIARERDKITNVPLPAYDGDWNGGAVSGATLANDLPPKRERTHVVACTSFTTLPVFARLTYAYRPWLWQRRLPFKMIWCGMAFYTSINALGAAASAAAANARLMV